MLIDLAHGELARADHVFLTATDPASRRGCTVELWFAVRDDTVYVLATPGDATGWVHIVERNPVVDLRIGRVTRTGRVRHITSLDEELLARRLVTCKYQVGPADGWSARAVPLAVDLG